MSAAGALPQVNDSPTGQDFPMMAAADLVARNLLTKRR